MFLTMPRGRKITTMIEATTGTVGTRVHKKYRVAGLGLGGMGKEKK